MRTAPEPVACSAFSTSNFTANWTLAEVRHHENEEAFVPGGLRRRAVGSIAFELLNGRPRGRPFCRTGFDSWEVLDAEGRRLTQLLAQLSISKNEGTPVRRFIP